MINNNQDDGFLSRTLSRLLPEAFFHPLWIHFLRNSSYHSSDFIRFLLHNLEFEQGRGDPISDCQLTFLCAYLHSRLGEHSVALASIKQIWEISERYGLQQIARCAAWGACAICVRQHNYPEAVGWLDKLQQSLKMNHEWHLFSVLELFKQNLQGPEQESDELLVGLHHWGEWSFSGSTAQSEGIHKSQRIVAGTLNIVERLIHGWSLFRDFLGKRSRGRRPSQLSSHYPAPSSRSSLLSQEGQSPVRLSNIPKPRPSPVRELGSLRSLAVYCMGPFQVYRDEQLVENWLSRKALSIFKYLILEHPVPVVKEVLMDTFWPESDLESARRNLHQAIYALRQILRGDQEDFHHIFFRNDRYSLNPDLETWIDYREFERHIEAGRRLDQAGHSEEAMEQYEISEELYKGDFLEEDVYEDWSNLQREKLRNSYFSLVERLTELYLKTDQHMLVIHLCDKVLARDRCYEALHRKLMQCFMAQGQRHLAIRQYQTCIRALREDLGIQPSRETVDLYRRIAAKPDT